LPPPIQATSAKSERRSARSARPAAAVTTISARRKNRAITIRAAIGLFVLAFQLGEVAASPDDPDAVTRGAYLVRAGGCIACHTDVKNDGAPLAGGGSIETPFGTFFAPNLTPHAEHGLGAWSEADFTVAMTLGRAPNGGLYYPAFPYPAYSAMTRGDLADMWAYLQSLEAVDRPDAEHELAFPFSLRAVNLGWQLLFFKPQRWRADPDRSAKWNRGAYLARHFLHCGECHTPRNALGAKQVQRAYAGHRQTPDQSIVPNITSHQTGIADWSAGDIVWLLQTGFMPQGDDIQGEMALLVEHGSSHLTDEDLAAVADYILSLPPIDNRLRRETEAGAGDTDDDEFDYDY
jgi:mono/diheme cytochrome c family protein